MAHRCKHSFIDKFLQDKHYMYYVIIKLLVKIVASLIDKGLCDLICNTLIILVFFETFLH